MEKQPLTIYQRLTKAFGFQGSSQKPPSFEFDKNELLKTDSKTDFDKARLQAQQTQYIADKWSKLDMSLYNQSVYYEPNRLSAYYDYESMEFSISELTKIATPDGFVTIKELSDKGRDYEFIVYSYDHNLKKVVPALARNAHYTRDEMTYKITFDDNSFIIATYGHRFLKRDGVYCKVEDLKEGDSMMPFYRKSFYNNNNYNWIYCCNPNEGYHGWVSEHNLIAEWYYDTKVEFDEVVHHKDFNGKNNLPNNLQIMKTLDHRSYHAQVHNKKMWSNPEYKALMSEVAKRKGKYCWNGRRSGVNNPAYFHIPFDLIIETAKKNRTLKGTSKLLNIAHTKLQREIMNAGYRDWSVFCDAYGIKRSKYSTAKVKGERYVLNHKIYSIEPYGIIPVYDLTVPGYKNFATDTIFSHNTPEVSAALDIYSEESCLVGTTKIPLLNGEEITIKELFDNKYKNFWVYGVDIKNDSIKPSKVEKIIFKGNKNVYKITLDDDTELICTDNHKWLTSDNKWVETKDLQFGSSLKSIYQKTDSKGYEKISLKDSFYKFTHTIVGESELKKEKEILLSDPKINNQLIILHHKSFNKRNNNPDQLEYMFWNDHQKLHTDLNKERWNDEEFSIKMKKIFSETAKKTWSEHKDEMSKKFSISIKKHMNSLSKNEKITKYGRRGNQNGMYGVSRNGITNPNYDKNKNHFNNINENEYIEAIKTLSGNYRSILEKKYNLTNQAVIRFNRFLCRKYNLQRIEDIKFTTEGFSIEQIKKFINDEKCPKRKKGKYCKINNINYGDFNRFIKKRGYKDWSDIVDHLNNHRIVNIEYFGNEEVYDLFNSSVDSTFGVKCNNGMVISHNCTKSERGQILTIHSDSKRIKHILDDLFYNVLDINTSIQMWTRGMCKYGDNFVYLKIDPEKGIIGCQQLPNIEVERLEGARQSTPNQSDRVGSRFPSRELRFTWKNKDMEFQAWEIAHFRILGDDRKLPYGTSMLDKIRRIWKQLLLAEDAMLIYRTSRAPERRVFKVFVGNMDDKDIEPYVQKIANKFKRDQVVDQKNGQVDMRYNQMAVDQDYFIPVRDPNQPSPIETLPGAQNLGEIADIEYIQKKMLAALRIPKAFLGFEDVIGNGKGLALLDIRFARTINRIQQSVIQELNKIALIHLFLLGLEDELNNFTLMMTNPSGQSDLLKIEQWKEKITMYKDATSDQSQMGILPVSHTWAKKNILGMSDNEVILDLQQQRLERAIGFELVNTQTIIRRSGIFDDVDKKYGISEEERKKLESAGGAQPAAEPGGSPGGGGGGGGSVPEMASPGATAGIPGPTGAELGAPAGGAPAAGAAPLSESRKFKILSMLNEDITLENLFDAKKAQDNIYEIEKSITDILNQ